MLRIATCQPGKSATASVRPSAAADSLRSAASHPEDCGCICLTLRGGARATQDAMADQLYALGRPNGTDRLLGQTSSQDNLAGLAPRQSQHLLFTG